MPNRSPLEKHSVSRRRRRRKGVLVFLARDATERVLRSAHAGIPKTPRPDEVPRFVDFWRPRTGRPPEELVFDSQLTTPAHRGRLNRLGVRFRSPRRRTRGLPRAIWSRPASAWRRITWNSLTRTYRTPKVLDERIRRKDDAGEWRQVTIIEWGHEEPTVPLTNDFRSDCPALVTRYARRMRIENGISEAIPFFDRDARSSMVGLKGDFDLRIPIRASALYRLLADRIGREYAKARARTLSRNLLDVSATVPIAEAEVTVTVDKRAHNPYRFASGLADHPTPMPWFGDKLLRTRFA